MPEIPDLEAIRHYLMPRLKGLTVTSTDAPIPWLIRSGSAELQTLEGHQFGEIHRLGKFLVCFIDDGRLLVINPMLTGRFHWVEADAKKRGRLGVVIGFDDGHELRYSDMRRMGRWYLVPGDGIDSVPQIAKLGPDALAIEREDFVERLRKRRGQIKNTLKNQEFLAGIGNAYSDEILWEARLHPHRKGSTLEDEDRERLFDAIHTTLDDSIKIVDETVQDEGLGRKEEWRQHLKVHRQGGEACPRCGSDIKGQVRSGSETNYCLTCQPLFD